MVNSLIIGMLLVIVATFSGALGALLFKIASSDLSLNWRKTLANGHLWGGVFLYSVSAMIFVVALKFGELSLLYPLAALSYVWISFLSVIFLKEKIDGYKIVGLSFIILGVIFIGLGA
ncbi:EamA family transporter [Candidatus Woesearchaeota archaeon]|nr:EamA family transporter [Candidatus Woesearchaeota archaeon]